jgi:hypothetical protein
MADSFKNLESAHRKLCDKYAGTGIQDAEQRAEIDQFVMQLRLAGQYISEITQRATIQRFLTYWGNFLLNYDGMVYPPLKLLLPTVDIGGNESADRDGNNKKHIKQLTQLQLFGRNLTSKQWLASTRLLDDIRQDLVGLSESDQYITKRLRTLYAFSTAMDDRTFRSELLKNSCSPREVFFARQAVLVIARIVWDKQNEVVAEYTTKLRNTMVKAFTLDDLDVLASDLGIEMEEVGGNNLTKRSLNLINYLRKTRLSDGIFELASHCYIQRPNHNWDYGI